MGYSPTERVSAGLCRRRSRSLISLLVVIALLFAAIYKVLPDAEVAWGDVWIGTAATAVLFTVGKLLIAAALRAVMRADSDLEVVGVEAGPARVPYPRCGWVLVWSPTNVGRRRVSGGTVGHREAP